MSSVTYSQLESQRRKWEAVPMPTVDFDTQEGNIPQIMVKCIALGLHLELPVAQWVGEATKRELPITKEARYTLGRNINDENVHFRAFTFAHQAYYVPIDIMQEAEIIQSAWNDNDEHPLMKAALAETGVFLPSLAVMRLFGGQSLSTLAGDVSTDERRHVAVNRGILTDIGINPRKPDVVLDNLRETTLSWLLAGFNIPDYGIDLDWMMDQSTQLVEDGYAPELFELTDHSEYKPPFEIPNFRLGY